MDSFALELNNPLTEEQWDTLTDVDLDRTTSITYHTKHGKEWEFVKVVRCGECKFWTKQTDSIQGRCALFGMYPTSTWFCGNARRREDG